MVRAIIYLLVSILIITFIRMVIGIIMRSMGQMLKEQATVGSTQPNPRTSAPVGGELKRDPVCGTFVPSSTAFQKTVKGNPHYFCSAECRDKYA